MTRFEIDLIDKGARLYARQVMARAELATERADQERLRQKRAAEFWQCVDEQRATVIEWPRRTHGN